MSLIDSINKHFETRSEIYNVLSKKNVTLPTESERYLSCVPGLINSISGWTGPGDPQYHCQLKIKIKYNENLSESEVNDIKNLINSNDTENNTLLEIKLNNNNDIYQFKLVTLDPESDSNVYFITTPTITDCKIGILLPTVNGIKYGASPAIHNISPENNYTIELTINKLQAEAVFYERIQIKENVGSEVSYLRKRTYDSNGNETIDFGYFTNKDNLQVWVDQSGIRMSIATVNTDNTISTSYIDSKGGELYNNYIDLHDVLKDDFGMKHVKVIVKTKDQDIDNDFIQLKKFYTRTYIEIINFITKNSDNVQLSSKSKTCIVTSITPSSTPPELLTDYHIHSAFQKFIRQDTGSITIKDGDYAYLPCYRASISAVQDENDNELSIIVSKPGIKASLTAGNYDIPQYRENDLELCKNNNKFDVIISSDNEIINLYKNNDERRFTSYTTYENDLQNLINYICFGIDPTQYFTSRSQKNYILGETSVLLNNGYYFGNFAASGKPILQCGVEDSNWASNGCIIFNALYQTSIPEPNSAKITNNWLVALDRKDIKVNNINNQLLLQNGYDILNYPIKSGIQNTRQGFDNRAGYIDFYFPTTDTNMDNITVGNKDAFLAKSISQEENAWLQILLDSSNYNTFKNTAGLSDRGNYAGQLFTLNTYLNNSGSFSDNLSNYNNDEEINFALITKLLSINNNNPIYASLYKYIDGPYFSFASSFTLSNRTIYECDNLIFTGEATSPLQVNISYSSGNHGVSIKSVELIDMETYTTLSVDNLSGFIGNVGHQDNKNYSRTFDLQNDINKYKNKNIVIRANLWIDANSGSTAGNITINNYNIISKTYSFDASKFLHVANSNNSIYHNVDQYAFFKFNHVNKDLLNTGTYLLVFKNSIEDDNLFSNIIQSRFNVLKAHSSSNKTININNQTITINNIIKPDLILYMDNNLPINSPDITIHYPVVNSDSNYTGSGSGPWCKDCDDTLAETNNNLTSIIKNGYIVDWWSALLSFNPIEP